MENEGDFGTPRVFNGWQPITFQRPIAHRLIYSPHLFLLPLLASFYNCISSLWFSDIPLIKFCVQVSHYIYIFLSLSLYIYTWSWIFPDSRTIVLFTIVGEYEIRYFWWLVLLVRHDRSRHLAVVIQTKNIVDNIYISVTEFIKNHVSIMICF